MIRFWVRILEKTTAVYVEETTVNAGILIIELTKEQVEK